MANPTPHSKIGGMNGAKRRRLARARDPTRWWRDGLVCACIGALGGLIGSVVYGSLLVLPIATAAGGILGAVFGDRILPFLQCFWA